MAKTAMTEVLPAAAAEGHAGTLPAPITPMHMLQIAVEKGADLEQMRQLMDLQERWEANEARRAAVTALTAFKAAPTEITKNKHVSFPSKGGQTEYDHATLDNVCKVVGKAMGQHGLSYRWEVEQPDGGAIRVTCVLTHQQGHSERVSLQAGADQSGGKNNIQAVASTVTYLERYTLLAITGLATMDQDDDAAGGDPELISAEQKEKIVVLMREVNADTDKFLAYLGVDWLDKLPASKFDLAIAALEKKRGK